MSDDVKRYWSGETAGLDCYLVALADYAALQQQLEAAQGEVERLQAINRDLLKQKDGVDKDSFTIVCDERDVAYKRAEHAEAELNETWVDEHGTVWTRPTAWAYAQVCKARDARQAAQEHAEARVRELEQTCNEMDAALKDAGRR